MQLRLVCALHVAGVRHELMNVLVGGAESETDDPFGVDANGRSAEIVRLGRIGVECLARPRISTQRTRHGSTDGTSSTTNATFPLSATLRNLWLAAML